MFKCLCPARLFGPIQNKPGAGNAIECQQSYLGTFKLVVVMTCYLCAANSCKCLNVISARLQSVMDCCIIQEAMNGINHWTSISEHNHICPLLEGKLLLN